MHKSMFDSETPVGDGEVRIITLRPFETIVGDSRTQTNETSSFEEALYKHDAFQKTVRTSLLATTTLEVYLFSDIVESKDFDFTFDGFSYGEARYTIMSKEDLLEELDDVRLPSVAIMKAKDCLRSLPTGALVAFDC